MRYILGVFGVIVLLLLVVILIVRNGSDEPATVQTGKAQVVLADYKDKPAVFSLKTSGDITADEERRTILISVSAQERVMEVLEGYDETVFTRHTFPNNDNAYKTFLSALDTAGFSRGRETNIKDSTGVCPFGRHFEYKLQDGSEQVLLAWNTSCGEREGSFGGDGRTIRNLFEAQIPDYKNLVKDINL